MQNKTFILYSPNLILKILERQRSQNLKILKYMSKFLNVDNFFPYIVTLF